MRRTIAFLAYPGLTLLDLAGPLQVFETYRHTDPTLDLAVVGGGVGATATDTPLGIVPSHTFAEVPAPFAVVVPGGGRPTLRAMADEKILDYLRGVAPGAAVMASVCTGSLLLAAAGLLTERRATTHWAFRDVLARLGAIPTAARWVDDGDVVTSAGVAAGIDMALHLVGRFASEDAARLVQLRIEYDPQPPFGPLDWTAFDLEAMRQQVVADIMPALADHPDLAARLTPLP